MLPLSRGLSLIVSLSRASSHIGPRVPDLIRGRCMSSYNRQTGAPAFFSSSQCARTSRRTTLRRSHWLPLRRLPEPFLERHNVSLSEFATSSAAVFTTLLAPCLHGASCLSGRNRRCSPGRMRDVRRCFRLISPWIARLAG
eukprot:5911153-Pleurochrysis_carterae.AAC.2